MPLLTLKDNGGVAVALCLARALADAGHDVSVVASEFHGRAAASRSENHGIRFHFAPALGRSRLLAVLLFFAWACAWSICSRRRLIYTHMATGLVPSFSSQRPLMLAQDLEYRFYARAWRRFAKPLFAGLTRRCDLLVTSRWLERFFRRRACRIVFAGDVGIAKAFVADAAVPAGHVRGVDVFLVAKRGAHKRHDETCQVAQELAEQGRKVRLIDQAPSAASPPPGPMMEVTLAVDAAEMRRLFTDARVFISLSRAEGYGLTPLEALALGCRVVTTPTPSTISMTHPALQVVRGSDGLIDNVLAAAHMALGPAAQDRSAADSYDGPLMEGWAASAVSALARSAGNEVQHVRP